DKGVHATSQYFPAVNPLAANPEDSVVSTIAPGLSNVSMPSPGNLAGATGVTFLEASVQLRDGIANEENKWINTISGGAALSLDILAFCGDPIGYVAGQLLSWMLEHVEPLRMVLDGLAGNPAMIKSYAASWESIATEMVAVG